MAETQLWQQHPSTVCSVYLLADHEVVRRALRNLLEPEGFNIIGESGSAREAG